MSMVIQNADGLVIVNVGSQRYVDTAANAASDYGFATPTLPTGAVDRTYDQGIRHAFTDGGMNVVSAGPIPWTTGDNYISGITAALAKQAARPPVLPPPPKAVAMEASDAVDITQAGPDDASSEARPGVRQTHGYTTVRGERVRSSGQENGNSKKEERRF